MSLQSKASLKAEEPNTLYSSFHAKKTNLSALIHSPVDEISFLQRTIGNREVQRLLKSGVIQAKLTSGQFGDAFEQGADRVAEQVMRTPEPQFQSACPCGGGCPKCHTEQPDREPESLQTKRVEASDTGQVAAPPIVHEVLRSPGQPFDSTDSRLHGAAFRLRLFPSVAAR